MSFYSKVSGKLSLQNFVGFRQSQVFQNHRSGLFGKVFSASVLAVVEPVETQVTVLVLAKE